MTVHTQPGFKSVNPAQVAVHYFQDNPEPCFNATIDEQSPEVELMVMLTTANRTSNFENWLINPNRPCMSIGAIIRNPYSRQSALASPSWGLQRLHLRGHR